MSKSLLYRCRKDSTYRRWVIQYEELDLQEEIGVGDFGTVHLAKWRNSKVVVKKLFHRRKMTNQELDDFRTEADILMYLIPHLMNRVKRGFE